MVKAKIMMMNCGIYNIYGKYAKAKYRRQKLNYTIISFLKYM